jgi:HlyD family secretion protein
MGLKPKPPQVAIRQAIRLWLKCAICSSLVLYSSGSRFSETASREVELDSSSLTLDTVRVGTLVREVKCFGSLVPEELFRIVAPVSGRIATISLWAGERISAGALLMKLANPDLELQVEEAMRELERADADVRQIQAQLRGQEVSRQSDLAILQAQLRDAKAKNERDAILYRQGLMLELDYRLSNNAVSDLGARIGIEEQRAKATREALEAQLASRLLAVRQATALLEQRKHKIAELTVRSARAGVVQRVSVQVGQAVLEGTDLAEISLASQLKAALGVAEAQAREIHIGQSLVIEANGTRLAGRVSRIDASIQNGTRLIEAKLEGPPPQSLLADQSVSSRIQVEKLDGIRQARRPAGSNHANRVFKVSVDGLSALPVEIKIGRSWGDIMEIVGGLEVGDRIIVSDIGAAETAARIILRQ